jgi:hypothetical protein
VAPPALRGLRLKFWQAHREQRQWGSTYLQLTKDDAERGSVVWMCNSQAEGQNLEPHLRGNYRLPRMLRFDADVVLSPAELPILVGSVPGQAMLPELRVGAFGGPQLVTPSLLREEQVPERSDLPGPSTTWGFVLGERLADAREVHVYALAMRFSLSTDKPSIATRTSQLLFESIGPWSQRLADWLEVVLGRPTRQLVTRLPRRPMLEHRDGLQLHHVDAEGNRTMQLAVPGPETGFGEPKNRIEESTWRAILGNVSEGLNPPTERLLLRDARVAIEEEHPRRAVLDAGTATEIALSRLLDTRLQGVPGEIAKLVREQNRELGRLRSALGGFGVQLPPSLQQNLVKLRNDAIHSGDDPPMDKARTALSLAMEIVEQAQPLDNVVHGPLGRPQETEQPQ